MGNTHFANEVRKSEKKCIKEKANFFKESSIFTP